MDWPSLVRKYVWDEEKTPYLVRSDRLTPAQARSELFVYAFLLAVLAAVVGGVTSVAGARIGAAGAVATALYAFSVLAAAVVLGIFGHPIAAVYCATAPAVIGVAAMAGVLRSEMTGTEKIVLTGLSSLWLLYAARIVRVTRRLRSPDGATPGEGPRR